MNALPNVIKKQPTGAFKALTAAGAASQVATKLAKVLTTTAREHVSKKNFALPEKKNSHNPAGEGGYPIPDKAHARNALARVSQHGSPSEKSRVRAKVHAKYPDIGKEKKASFIDKMAKHMPHFEDQDRPEKAKEVFHALKEEHPEYSAGKKARIANAVANGTVKH